MQTLAIHTHAVECFGATGPRCPGRQTAQNSFAAVETCGRRPADCRGMYGFLYRLGTWLATKLSVAILIVVLGLAAFGGWLFLRDHVLAESQREQHLEDLVRR